MPDTKQPFQQSTWSQDVIDDCRQLIHLALKEDFQDQPDWTTVANVPENARASAAIVSRKDGVFVGANVAQLVLDAANSNVELEVNIKDGESITQGQTAMVISGNARELLSLERTILNFAGRLSGIASLTQQFVSLVAHTHVAICDTRKTTPGWRRLEKYAVQCGGGSNHRMGLYDAILIKDNHLAFVHDQNSDWSEVMSQSVSNAKKIVAEQMAKTGQHLILQIEVDTLEQFRFVIDEQPDIILLDNMSNTQLKEAVDLRAGKNANVLLEASGGVNLDTVQAIAETGVDRISIGALTHSAVNFDLGLDWKK